MDLNEVAVDPPNPPWKPLEILSQPEGYLSYYYSDDISPLPVRWVTKPGDNKSDPNLETSTYGLFSTCSSNMRRGVVKYGRPYIFFITNRNGVRVLSGYYHIKWYVEGAFSGGWDFSIAADKVHFVNPPISLVEIDKKFGLTLAKHFRTHKGISHETCCKLRNLLDLYEDSTASYLEEIDRLERFNLQHGEYRYIGWKQKDKFSWEYARQYFKQFFQESSEQVIPQRVKNSNDENQWFCSSCQRVFVNKSLLRRCPNCGELASLQPISKNAGEP
ncbi:MAG: hypothetical protein PHW56_07215 [Methanosarcinaceae archaeon]|nr:hypothetical protein [Methanosarcinaceae archaeon]